MLLEAAQYVVGGLLITSAVGINQRYGKRVTEPSNSLYSMLTLNTNTQWTSSFVAGMLFLATLTYSIFGFEEVGTTGVKPLESDKLFFQGTGLVQFALSGLLIGIGTRMAQGGLTKYALYGIPKFDYSSLVATATVLIFGVITATLRSTLPVLQGANATKFFNEHLDFRLSFIFPFAIIAVNLFKNINSPENVKDILRSFFVGILLAAGMMTAGFTRRHLVLDFLNLNNKHWNPFLIFVALGAVLGNMVVLNLLSFKGPVEDAPLGLITPRILAGCALFGIGMGISGLTPGSGLLVAPIYLPYVVMFFLPFIIVGQLLGGIVGGFFGNSIKSSKVL